MVRVRSPEKSPAQRSVLARVSVGALLSASVIVIGVAIAASLGVTWPGGQDSSRSPHIKSMPDESALALPNVEPRRAHKSERDRTKKKHERRQTVLMGSDVKVLAPQGLVITQAPVVSRTPAAPVDETVAVAPKPQRSPAKRSPAKQPAAAAATTPLPVAPAGQAIAAKATGLVRLSVQSVAVAPNAASNPELLVKMGIDGANPADAVPDTVTLHLLPQVPATVPKDDPTLALTARVDMVDAPRTGPTDPALRMRVRMAITPVEAGTPMVQDPGAGDGKSNVIALTVSLASFSDEPQDGPPPDQPADPEQPGPGGPGPDQPGPVDPAPEQPGPVGPGPEQPGPVDPAPEQPGPVDPAPEQPGPVDPAPEQPGPVDPAPEQPPAGGPATAPIPPIEIIIPIGPVRPNTGSTTVPITPGTGNDAPTADPIPVDVVLEELPPDAPSLDTIPVDVVLEELPPYDPPVDPAEVPTPAAEEPAVDVPGPPSEPGPAPDTGQTSVDTPPAVPAPVVVDATAQDSGS
jgi:hypothetical protein